MIESRTSKVNPFRSAHTTWLAILVTTMLQPAAGAQEVWTGGGANADWSTDANWTDGSNPGNGFNTAFTFNGAAPLTNSNNLTGGTSTGISFTSSAGEYVIGGNSMTLSGGATAITNASAQVQTFNLPIAVANATQTITMNGGGGVKFAGGLSGVGENAALTLSGGAILTISGTSNVLPGILNLPNTSGLGLALATNSTFTVGRISTGGNLGGSVDLASGSVLSVSNAGSSINAYAGKLTGSGSLVNASSGRLRLSGNSTAFTGKVRVDQGEARVNVGGGIGDLGTWVLNGTSVNNAGVFLSGDSGATYNIKTAFNSLSSSGGYIQLEETSTFNLSGAFSGTNTTVVFRNGSASSTGVANLTGDWSGFTGTVRLGDNTYGSKVSLNALQSSSAITAYVLANANSVLQSAVLGGGTVPLGSITSALTGTVLRGNVAGTTTFSIGALNSSTTYGGTITDGSVPTSMFTALTKVGSGTLTISGANTFSGGVVINSGTLMVENISGSGLGTGSNQVTAGTLGGNGSISGSLTVGDGGGVSDAFLATGNAGVGTLTINSTVSLLGDATFVFELNNSTSDKLAANGLMLNSPLFSFSNLGDDSGVSVGDIFTVIDNTSAAFISGEFTNLPNGAGIVSGSYLYTADYFGGTGNDLIFTVGAVPEPSSSLLLGLGLVLLACRRIRRS